MAGAWTTATLDLVIPSSGALTPGSNTVYIGGPRLPVALKNLNVSAALVWYTNAAGFAAGYDYWFLAHVPIGLNVVESMIFGYKKTSNPSVSVIWSANIDSVSQKTNFNVTVENIASLVGGPSASIQSDNTQVLGLLTTFVQGFNSLLLQVPNAAGTFDLDTPGGAIRMGSVTATGPAGTYLSLSNFDSVNRRPKLKVINPLAAQPQDQWVTIGPGARTIGGVANCQVTIDYRWTADYIMEVRVNIACPAAVGVGVNTVNVPLAGGFTAIPSPDASPGGWNPLLPCSGQGGAAFSTMLLRFDSTANMALFTNGNPNNNTTFQATGLLTLAK